MEARPLGEPREETLHIDFFFILFDFSVYYWFFASSQLHAQTEDTNEIQFAHIILHKSLIFYDITNKQTKVKEYKKYNEKSMIWLTWIIYIGESGMSKTGVGTDQNQTLEGNLIIIGNEIYALRSLWVIIIVPYRLAQIQVTFKMKNMNQK